MTTPHPAPAVVSRFRRDVEAVMARPIVAEERLALAVSGGPDSMAMLALAGAAFPGQVIAATVDHGLRAESADEAAMVACCCHEAGIAHRTLRIASSPAAGDNLHAWARQERYRMLQQWALAAGAASLATAHHADDQAETFLMRAARGAGLSGLAAVRPRRDGEVEQEAGASAISAPLLLIRPLLGWRHAELVAIAAAAGLPFVEDPSNDDDRFDRTRFRRLLAGASWIDPVPIARSAAYLAEVDADLRALAAWLWKVRAQPAEAGDVRIDVADLPRTMRRHLAHMAIAHVLETSRLGVWSRATNIESLLDALETAKSASQDAVLGSAKGSIWHFRQAPPRRSH